MHKFQESFSIFLLPNILSVLSGNLFPRLPHSRWLHFYNSAEFVEFMVNLTTEIWFGLSFKQIWITIKTELCLMFQWKNFKFRLNLIFCFLSITVRQSRNFFCLPTMSYSKWTTIVAAEKTLIHVDLNQEPTAGLRQPFQAESWHFEKFLM